jgi:hypothetical protein
MDWLARQEHSSDESLEKYSLNELAESNLPAVEAHLLVCASCRARLDAIEPVNYIHYTEDGLIYSRATRLTSGRVIAQHWGSDLHGGRVFRTVTAARKYLDESFSQMFPEHACSVGCTKVASPPRAVGPAPAQCYVISYGAKRNPVSNHGHRNRARGAHLER